MKPVIYNKMLRFPLVLSMQKVAQDKGTKAKKGGAKGKKEDGPAQNGDTKTNEVRWGGICFFFFFKSMMTSLREKKRITISTPFVC